ncbi:MAG: trypsin-like peptidase domain-containing protein [Rhodobacteraceae bacterium]|nr:trypsin-like peptidase domain-containing protein [Paracoccaceae bacterium]
MRHVATALLLAGCFATEASAERRIEETIAYIECKTPSGQISRGTGVVVSRQGHVLTAKHVVPDGSTCEASLAVADSNNTTRMVVQPTNLPVDAALLRFVRQQDYAFVGYCALEDWMVRQSIFVAGFPGQTETGAASFREGILSTVFPNAEGVLETDGQTVAGMSGGPVYSRNLAGLVGIVIGAEFAVDGTVNYYGILPASFYASSLGMSPAEEPCYFETPVVIPSDPVTGADLSTWRAGDEPIDLGVTRAQGTCFLRQVDGAFDDKGDSVSVVLKEGRFFISGTNGGEPLHGGAALCVRHP